jgi:ribosomal protein S24E
MDISISSEKENKLFSRKEILFTATSTGSKTPSKEEVKEAICKKLSLNPDLTTVIKITQEYGSNVSEIIVHSYSKKEAMDSLVRKPKEKKEKAPKAAPPAAKAEEKKEEAPKEEKKEAPKPAKAEAKKEEKKEEAKK